MYFLDLNDRNCFWGVVPLHHLSRKSKYQLLGRPLKLAISWVEGLWKPGEIVMPLELPANLHTEAFYLGDFGLAMELGDPLALVQEGPFCSPDRLHKKPPSTACDMWSYMCIFAELYLGFVPFTIMADGGAVTSIISFLFQLAVLARREAWAIERSGLSRLRASHSSCGSASSSSLLLLRILKRSETLVYIKHSVHFRPTRCRR